MDVPCYHLTITTAVYLLKMDNFCNLCGESGNLTKHYAREIVRL